MLDQCKLFTDKVVLTALAVLWCLGWCSDTALAALSITDCNSEKHGGAEEVQEISGITYAGGNQYYAVEDKGGLLVPITIALNKSNGNISSIAFGDLVQLPLSGSANPDHEGVAYNPANNSVFVSSEKYHNIKEYSLNGVLLSEVTDAPLNLSACRSNFSLESLTIRGDGLEMFTCNEEALYSASLGIDDGPISTQTNGSYVRLTRFSRNNVHDTWSFSGQWAYLTDPIAGSAYNGSERSGVSDLCALPDGTLLVLEREMSKGTLLPSFRTRIYQVNFTGATEISEIRSLNGATFTSVGKLRLYERSGSFMLSNYEGICLGPRLNDGSLSLILVSDGGSNANKDIRSLKLSGLNVWELSVESAHGTASPVGTPYRVMAGSEFTAAVVEPPVTGVDYARCTGWSLSNHTPNSGSGTTLTYVPTADATLVWQWENVTFVNFPATDSFEEYQVGVVLDNIFGWSGTGVVTLESYPQPADGYPIPEAAHTKILRVHEESAIREVNSTAGASVTTEMMVQMTNFEELPGDLSSDAQVALLTDETGQFHLWHLVAKEGGGWEKQWTPLHDTPKVIPDEWVRVSITMNYSSNSLGHTFCCPCINGKRSSTNVGYVAPDDMRSPGPWFVCANSPGASGGGNRYISELVLQGQGAIDDLVIRMATSEESEPGSGEEPGGGDAPDPSDKNQVWLSDARLVNGQFHLEFQGSNLESGLTYIIEHTTDLTSHAWEPVYGPYPLDSSSATINTWSTPLPEGGGKHFYRIRILPAQ